MRHDGRCPSKQLPSNTGIRAISPGTFFWRLHTHSNPTSLRLERQAEPTRSSLGHEEARYPFPQPHGFSKGSSGCWFPFPVSPLPATTPPGTTAGYNPAAVEWLPDVLT